MNALIQITLTWSEVSLTTPYSTHDLIRLSLHTAPCGLTDEYCCTWKTGMSAEGEAYSDRAARHMCMQNSVM